MREQLTESDVKKIEEEIQHRKHVIRKEAIEAVKEARAQGDLSENFEYHAAKKYKNQNESRIRYLESSPLYRVNTHSPSMATAYFVLPSGTMLVTVICTSPAAYSGCPSGRLSAGLSGCFPPFSTDFPLSASSPSCAFASAM